MPMTSEEFAGLPADKRREVLQKMRAEKEFTNLPSRDRDKVLQLMRAQKEAPMTQTEAALRGGSQGALMEWRDEIVAGLTAAGKKFINAVMPSSSEVSFSSEYDKAVTRERARDDLAAEQFPKTYQGTKIGAGVATLLIPAVMPLKAAKAAENSLAFKEAVTQGVKYLAPEFAAPVATEAARKIGTGVAAGVKSFVKGAALGGATALGEMDAMPKDRQEAINKLLPAAKAQAVASIVGPVLRGTSAFAVKMPGEVAKSYARSILPTGPGGVNLADAVINSTKTLGKESLEKMRIEPLVNALKSGGKIAGKVGDVLVEAYEKQGAAGLTAAHIMLLKKPEYQQFLDQVETKKSEK